MFSKKIIFNATINSAVDAEPLTRSQLALDAAGSNLVLDIVALTMQDKKDRKLTALEIAFRNAKPTKVKKGNKNGKEQRRQTNKL